MGDRVIPGPDLVMDQTCASSVALWAKELSSAAIDDMLLAGFLCVLGEVSLPLTASYPCLCLQVSVQPVTAAGPEHSKPLEKAETLFPQERDPRFSEIYPSISTGRGSCIW